MINNNLVAQRVIVVLATLLYIAVAVNSSGYHHEDEHYQTIGFAEFRAGNTQDYTWELKSKIRSSIQPVICMIVFNGLRSMQITDPFHLALALRLLTAALSISIILYFTKACQQLLEPKYWLYFFAGSFFLWLLPYINVRYSSETWSGLFCLFSVGLVLSKITARNSYNSVFLGVSMGLAILFRFQALVLCLGLLTWIFFNRNKIKSDFLIILTCLTGTFILGILLDSWFYKEWTFAFYNYLKLNVWQGVASYYGQSPWYEIIYYLLERPTYFIGVLIILSLVNVLFSNSYSIFIWTVIPFLVVHSLAPHKELRFLFPLANFIPIILALSFQLRYKAIVRLPAILRYLVVVMLVLVNLTALAIVTTKSTRSGETAIAEYIFNSFRGFDVNVISTFEANPFDPQMSFQDNFYKSPKTIVTPITSLWDEDFASKIKPGYKNIIVITADEYFGEKTEERLKELRLTLLKRSLAPHEITIIGTYNRWVQDIFPLGKQLSLYGFQN